jgi:hypothetical protein
LDIGNAYKDDMQVHNVGMQIQQMGKGMFEHIANQGEFLLRTYRSELGKDPNSRATESSRSNLLAMGHTVSQMYGEAVAREADLVPTRRANF